MDAQTRTFSATHVYEDDAPSGTLSDEYDVAIVVTDQDEASGNSTPSVTVANISPVGHSLDISDPTIDEGESVTLSGTFSDVGTLDTHSVVIDWGDGSIDELSADSTLGFSREHQFTLGDSSSYTIDVTLFDDDGGQFEFTPIPLSVNNVAPMITEFDVPSEVNDTDSVSFSAQAFDPADALTFNWLIVDPTFQSTTTTGQTIPFVPSMRGMYTVSLLVMDGDGGVDQLSTNVQVVNAPPSITDVAIPTVVNEADSINASAHGK